VALQFDARLLVAHIIPESEAFNYALGDAQDLVTKAVDEARMRLPGKIPILYRELLSSTSIVKSGDIREELLGIIEDERVDFVVMGTHGRQHLERFFLGSTTESILRSVPVPTLTVLPQSSPQEMPPAIVVPRRIVYATDLSEAANAGLHYSIEMARAYGAELVLVHATGLRDGSAFDSKADIRAILSQHLWRGVDKQSCADVHITAKIIDGIPYKEIVRFAQEANADMLALNLQSKGFLERAMLGSTAERVIRSSRIPVLSIPCSKAGRFVFAPERGVSCSFANA
jgi:nucleotide-binding universal stress UspA family protein